MPRSRPEALGHEQTERVGAIGSEGWTVLIAGCAVEPDGFGLPYPCLKTDTINVPLAGRIFQRLEQTPPYPISPGFRTNEHALYFGMSGRDDPECDRSEKFSVTASNEKDSIGCRECIDVNKVIALGWIQRLQVRA